MATPPADIDRFSPYADFTRAEWARLRDSTPLPLSEAELATLRGINENVSLDEVADIYLPLSRLLHLYVAATQDLHQITNSFLGDGTGKVPYVIGIAGSVAVGKSTTARILRELLARWPEHPRVELITTDGFLFPNRVLEQGGLMRRKGFPESYDLRRLVHFVVDVKSGRSPVVAPIYSHLIYDIVPDRQQLIERPDILIVEGLNVLQSGAGSGAGRSQVFVSDFFDFSIYVDAAERSLQRWYIERFQRLRETAFRDPTSYFHRYAALSDAEATQVAERLWREINAVNLVQNIEPTRERAQLILEKRADHSIGRVRLRKL